MGADTIISNSSSSILVANSTTPIAGRTTPSQLKGGEFGREDNPAGDKIDKLGLGQEGDDIDKLGLEQVGDDIDKLENGRDRERTERGQREDRDIKTSGLVGMSKTDRFSSLAAKGNSHSDSDSDSFIASEISLVARSSGPIGMVVELAPALTRSINGTVKDRLKSIEPEISKLTEAIPNESLEKKIMKSEKLNENKLSENKKCSTSNNIIAKKIKRFFNLHIFNIKCNYILKITSHKN